MKNKNIFLIILLLIILSNIGSAVIITTPVLFEIYSGTTYITVFNQTADFFNVSTAGHYLEINVNGTRLNFTTTTNKTLTGVSSYNGTINFTANGSGILTTTILTNNSLTPYNLYTDGILSSTITTDIGGNLIFNFTGDGITHNIMILQGSSPTPPLPSIQISKTFTCGGITGYANIAIPLFGLALMILAFAFILLQIRSSIGGETHISVITITSGILVSIVGFAMLILGNYILNSIFGALC